MNRRNFIGMFATLPWMAAGGSIIKLNSEQSFFLNRSDPYDILSPYEISQHFIYLKSSDTQQLRKHFNAKWYSVNLWRLKPVEYTEMETPPHSRLKNKLPPFASQETKKQCIFYIERNGITHVHKVFFACPPLVSHDNKYVWTAWVKGIRT